MRARYSRMERIPPCILCRDDRPVPRMGCCPDWAAEDMKTDAPGADIGKVSSSLTPVGEDAP
jgi:hypothetical protein